MSARGYMGPLVLLTPSEINRICGWAHQDRHPDEVTQSLREKTAAALDAHPSFRQPLR